jgi:hypothetical protein
MALPLRPIAVALLAVAAVAGRAERAAAEALEGEFTDINLGRPLLEPDRFPTVQELRAAVRKPEFAAVVMFKLFGDKNNHFLPAWSHDGRRLAFQQSDGSTNSSQVLLYDSRAQAAPKLLSDRPDAYDFMFRWGTSSPDGFVLARVQAESQGANVWASVDKGPLAERTGGGKRYAYPALYERTDRIYRLAYEREGEVWIEAFTATGPVEAPKMLIKGTAPRWGRDGRRLLALRERRRSGLSVDYDVVVRDLAAGSDQVLAAPTGGTVRGAVWSPDESFVAWHGRPSGEASPWRIHVAPTAPGGEARVVATDVVVNLDFDSEGPSWQPDGRRIWFFSHAHRREAYYPLAAVDVASGDTLVVEYPQRCTNPLDLAVNPATAVPEIAFVGHDGVTQDLFIVFLNHY